MIDKELSQQAKDYLAQIRKIEHLISRLRSTVATLRSDLTSIGCELKPDKVHTSEPKNTLEETVAKIDDLERKINIRIGELVNKKADALSRVEKISDSDRQNVLTARYVEGAKWERIAVDLNFSMRQVHRIHEAALLDFARENPDILKDGTL